MTIDLLPGHGVRLPAPLPELRFGLTEVSALRLLAPYGEALPDGTPVPADAAVLSGTPNPHEPAIPGGVHPTFVCGSTWALHFALPGVGVTLCPGEGERLRSVFVSRRPVAGEAACPVGLHGVDVFGWPAHEVVEALRAGGLPVPDPTHGHVRYGTLHLSRGTPAPRPPAGGRKPRHELPFTFGLVSLSAPETATPRPPHPQEST
ncbi:hypothetical protein [Kitasatospora sp. NPDC087314]|uniref:hypothetical protein n=1 Tax=Kitasatospora sp. NPDC087314 TaxID=3364068 RepID=UPI003810B1E3